MPAVLNLKPTSTPVKAYYEALADYARQRVKHEGALRSAFQNLLTNVGKGVGWTLIPELHDVPLSYRVEKMRLNKEKTALQVNDSLMLAGFPLTRVQAFTKLF